MKTNLLRLLTELSSRKWLAHLTGKFAKSSLSKSFIRSFIKTYKIDVDEAEKPLDDYASLNEFFTRKLKDGARPLDPDPLALLSPVDALIMGMGQIENGLMLNIKGQNYTIADLLNNSPRLVNYKNGYYYVLYLSPADYHRIHSPVAGTIIEMEHIPGKVYPVNDFALHHIDGVLSRNERLLTYIQHQFGEVALVKVGAMNVSSIQQTKTTAQQVERGEEFAYFEFGSTVVVLTESGTFKNDDRWQFGAKVRMGEALGLIQHR